MGKLLSSLGKTIVAWCVLEFSGYQPCHEYFFITMDNTEAEVMGWQEELSEQDCSCYASFITPFCRGTWHIINKYLFGT